MLKLSGHNASKYRGDFLDYLQLEGKGVFTVNGYDSDVLEKKREELRRFGASL